MSDARFSSNSAEWYTPSWLVETARRVLGSIDLDPASSEAANQTVRASKFYSSDGEMKEWSGNVFVNAPGSKQGNLVKRFWEKTTTSVKSTECSVFWVGFNMNQVCYLSDPPTNYLTCFLKKRVSYIDGRSLTEAKSPGHHSYVTLLSRIEGQTDRFCLEFRNLGTLVRGWKA